LPIPLQLTGKEVVVLGSIGKVLAQRLLVGYNYHVQQRTEKVTSSFVQVNVKLLGRCTWLSDIDLEL